MLKKLQKFMGWAQRYPVAVAALAILAYYLATTFDLLRKTGKGNFSFLDFFLHFDSLIWMWLVAFVFIKLQDTKKKYYDEERDKLLMRLQIEKSKIASTMLKEITKQLQDSINNPLAVIRVMTEDIRKRFVADADVMRRLDQVDSSLLRIHHAIKDVANYQTAKVLEALQTEVRAGVWGNSTNGDNEGELYQRTSN